VDWQPPTAQLLQTMITAEWLISKRNVCFTSRLPLSSGPTEISSHCACTFLSWKVMKMSLFTCQHQTFTQAVPNGSDARSYLAFHGASLANHPACETHHHSKMPPTNSQGIEKPTSPREARGRKFLEIFMDKLFSKIRTMSTR
jgi:hypothetical protein